MGNNINEVEYDFLIKGCTKPPMFAGIPVIPFFIIAIITIFSALFISIFASVIAIPLIIVARLIVKADDQAFTALYLKIMYAFNQNRVVVKKYKGKYYGFSSTKKYL